MSEDTAIDRKYQSAAQAIIKAGGMPLPINDTLLKLLRFYINEDDLDFVISFAKSKSQTMEQLKGSSGLTEDQILALVYRDVDPRLAPFARINIQSHLAKLREDGVIP